MSYQLHFERLVEYDPGDQGISLQITLKLGKTSVEVAVKIDTGAGGSIFSRQYGEQLGLVIENDYRQTFSTATGTFLTFGHFVTLNIAGIEFDTLVYFAADEHFMDPEENKIPMKQDCGVAGFEAMKRVIPLKMKTGEPAVTAQVGLSHPATLMV